MPGVAMQVVFYKEGDGRLCGWRAAPPKRRRFQGTTMASGRALPHDLAQFVVEDGSGPRARFLGLARQGGDLQERSRPPPYAAGPTARSCAP